jgi:hypothetical protein
MRGEPTLTSPLQIFGEISHLSAQAKAAGLRTSAPYDLRGSFVSLLAY